ncbi:MAG: Nif11-like leader peptide family RiPP precursor, partial [Synergistaceae bacterium]|nr:Nif11-like leader peptide family RiPP precursor [Synergistaceae bacterium]
MPERETPRLAREPLGSPCKGQESAKIFLERVNRDKNFARCFEGVESPETFLEIVRHRGYDFTKEDLKYAVVALSNMSLSEAELARVSGG